MNLDVSDMSVPIKDMSFDVNLSYSEILFIQRALLHVKRLQHFKRNILLIDDLCKRFEDCYYFQKIR